MKAAETLTSTFTFGAFALTITPVLHLKRGAAWMLPDRQHTDRLSTPLSACGQCSSVLSTTAARIGAVQGRMLWICWSR
jgi:hypothetical protein